MELGLLFMGTGAPLHDFVTLARQAEAAGFASVRMVEAVRSAWVPLTAMAAATTRVRLGPYVLNAYGRSPLITGMTAIDFNEFSGGRLELGVGGGNPLINEQWQGIPHVRVLTKMREYVEIQRQMARTRLGEKLDYTGKVHRMHWTPAIDPVEPPFPVILAAVYPGMLKVAAEVADGIGGGATLGVDYLRDVMRPQVASAAVAVDRDPARLRWTAVGFIAMDEDREHARAAARAAIAHLYWPLPHPYYEFTMREQGFSAAADACLVHMPAGRKEAAMDAIPDECLDRLVIAGTPAECRARLAAYAGVLDELVLINVLPAQDGDVVGSHAGVLTLPRALQAPATSD